MAYPFPAGMSVQPPQGQSLRCRLQVLPRRLLPELAYRRLRPCRRSHSRVR